MLKRFSGLLALILVAAATMSDSTPATAACYYDCKKKPQVAAAAPVRGASVRVRAAVRTASFKYDLRKMKFQVHYAEIVNDKGVVETRAVDRTVPAQCLADAMIGEAGSQTESHRRRIVDVVKNRIADGNFGSDICATIYQWKKMQNRDGQGVFSYDNCQFVFACEPRSYSAAVWKRNMEIAEEELSRQGLSSPDMVGVINYHANYTSVYWPNLQHRLTDGVHLFYARRNPNGTLLAYSPLVPRPPAPIPVREVPIPSTLAYAAAEVPAQPVQKVVVHPVPMPKESPLKAIEAAAAAKKALKAAGMKAFCASADAETSIHARFSAIEMTAAQIATCTPQDPRIASNGGR